LDGEFGSPFVFAGFEVDDCDEGFLRRTHITDAERAGFADDESGKSAAAGVTPQHFLLRRSSGRVPW
jgi:hypothetical protein